ncbi:MAG: YicC family protein [Mogibacterium sp.]|nr:YicC family protein [Mogibacterium sp.]
MVKSMTGYGRGEYTDGRKTITVEIKAVNHRYCDIYVKMPRRYSYAEEKIKSVIKESMSRGKIEVSVMIDNYGEAENDICLNEAVAAKYYEALKSLENRFGFENGKGLNLGLLANMPDVIKTVPAKEDEEAVIRMLLIPTREAVAEITKMRSVEGAKLAEDLMMRAGIVEDIKNRIAERAPEISREYAEKMQQRIHELLDGKAEVPEERILVEAAIFADKANITEELVRLGSHIDQLRSFLCTDGEAIGKKMDFFVQEMNREANTIGSKSNDKDITSWMLDLKAEIEKIREQVQNIE